MTIPDAYCSYCGSPFHPEAGWPRTCANCGQTTFRNPLPVSVVLVPISNGQGSKGLLTVRRGVAPKIGELAIPGGYINYGETWQEAGARELMEETGLRIDPGEIHELSVRSAPDGTLIVFGLARPRQESDLPAFSPNVEATERVILSAPAQMAFELHTQIVRLFFGNLVR